MNNLSQEVLNQLQEATKRPVGTFEFTYSAEENLFDPQLKGGVIFDLIAGKHYFRLERNDEAEILYYYSSPGTGTRVASVDLKKMKSSNKVFFALTWSPEEINLYVGPKAERGELINAKGKLSTKRFQVGQNGQVFQTDGEGLAIMGNRINIGGKQIIKPTAIDVWNETKKAIEILLTGNSKEGYIFDVVKSNLSIVMMVTGFEAYCKTRYQEIEGEGIVPNQVLVETKLAKSKENFQDFDGYCKNIFKFGYGINFFELVDSGELERLNQLFVFRSRIVHASPMLSMVNEFDVPIKEPIFSTNIINESLDLFNKFINSLHKVTLELKKDK